MNGTSLQATLSEFVERIGSTVGIPAWMTPLIETALLLLAAWLAYEIVSRYLLKLLSRWIEQTTFDWDDILLEEAVLRRASWFAPVLVVFYGIKLVEGVPAEVLEAFERGGAAILLLVGLFTFDAFLTSVNHLYTEHPVSKDRPIKGYLQVINIFAWVVGAVTIVALLLDRSPLAFITGIGAMTAVLLLIFRDTILSLVASIQIVSNDMVRIGDWIEMPKYGADGDVVDIALHTIKVQNFDKTITTIPTWKLIEDSFKNWRGMTESGGRRIMRSIRIDVGTIRFLDGEDVERFAQFDLLHDYIARKRDELVEDRKRHASNAVVDVNTRRLTNIGTFRAYIVNYLRKNPNLHQKGMTLLVRQLEARPDGLPIEIYVFTKTTNWVEYEAIQSDIFDHILAITPEFGLRVFQQPSSWDFTRFLERAAKS